MLKRLLILYCCSLAIVLPNANAEDQNTVIVAHPSVPVTSLSLPKLRLIFAGRTQFWPDGSRIKVFVLPAKSNEHQLFCTNYLGLFPYQLERIWQRITYSGQGDTPVVVATQGTLLDKVLHTPGAIAYSQQGVQGVKIISLEKAQ